MSDPVIGYQGNYCGADMVPGSSLTINNPVSAVDAAQLILYPPVITSSSLTLSNLTAMIAALPTTLPGTSGQLWLDGEVVAIS